MEAKGHYSIHKSPPYVQVSLDVFCIWNWQHWTCVRVSSCRSL